MDQEWSKVDFGTGKITFLDETLKEDILQVEYPNYFLLNMGWYHDRWVINIIQNFDWDHLVKQYITTDSIQLSDLLTQAVHSVEQVSQKETKNE